MNNSATVTLRKEYGDPLPPDQQADATVRLDRGEIARILAQAAVDRQPHHNGSWAARVSINIEVASDGETPPVVTATVSVWKET